MMIKSSALGCVVLFFVVIQGVNTVRNFPRPLFLLIHILDIPVTIAAVIAILFLGKERTGHWINLYSLIGASISWWPFWACADMSDIKIPLKLKLSISLFGGILTTFLGIFLILVNQKLI